MAKNADTKTTESKDMTATQRPATDVASFVKKGATNADIARLMNRAGSRLAPQLYTMEPGEIVHAYVMAKGTGTVEDKNTKQPKEIPAWILELRDGVTWRRGADISILGAVQLDRQLDPAVGCAVSIARGADVKHKGGLMTEYRVIVHEDLSRLSEQERTGAGFANIGPEA